MKTINTASILIPNVHSVQVVFKEYRGIDTKRYTFLTTEEFEVGDKAVVNSSREYEDHDQLQVVTVVDYSEDADHVDLHSDLVYSWVVCKIDTTKHDKIIETRDKIHQSIKATETRRMKEIAMTAAIDGMSTEERLVLDDLTKELESV